MMQLQDLVFLIRAYRRSGRRRRQFSEVRRTVRPGVEMLEGRWLPSTVTNLNDAGPGSLRQAIMDASSGDTIDFDPSLTGTITLTSGELGISKGLTIAGPGPDVLTISGNYNSGVFDIIGSSITVAISGLKITNGYTNTRGFLGGGGILTSPNDALVNVSVSDCVFSGNGVDSTGQSFFPRAGAIDNEGRVTTITIDDSIFSDNQASTEGGAIYNASEMTITNTTFDSNVCYTTVGPGGAGGAITTLGSLSITASTFSNNLAGVGGAICTTGTMTILNSTFNSNEALSHQGYQIGGRGGAIDNGSSLTVTSSTFNNNAAESGTMSLGMGGAIDISSGGGLSSKNTIIAGNSAASGPDVNGTATSQGHNLIGINDGTSSGWLNSDMVGTPTMPIDPKLNPLGNYGGPTQTQLPKKTSPAVNAGDNSNAPMYDQRGYTRIVNGTIDIGSVELQLTEFGPPGIPFPGAGRPNAQIASAFLVIRLNPSAQGLPTAAIAPSNGVSTRSIVSALSTLEQGRRASGSEQQGTLDTFFHLSMVASMSQDSEDLSDVLLTLPTGF